MPSYLSPINPSVYPTLAVILLVIGVFFTAWLCVYEVTTNKYSRMLRKELLLSATATVFMGVGTLFLTLWVGIYV